MEDREPHPHQLVGLGDLCVRSFTLVEVESNTFTYSSVLHVRCLFDWFKCSAMFSSHTGRYLVARFLARELVVVMFWNFGVFVIVAIFEEILSGSHPRPIWLPVLVLHLMTAMSR